MHIFLKIMLMKPQEVASSILSLFGKHIEMNVCTNINIQLTNQIFPKKYCSRLILPKKKFKYDNMTRID